MSLFANQYDKAIFRDMVKGERALYNQYVINIEETDWDYEKACQVCDDFLTGMRKIKYWYDEFYFAALSPTMRSLFKEHKKLKRDMCALVSFDFKRNGWMLPPTYMEFFKKD